MVTAAIRPPRGFPRPHPMFALTHLQGRPAIHFPAAQMANGFLRTLRLQQRQFIHPFSVVPHPSHPPLLPGLYPADQPQANTNKTP